MKTLHGAFTKGISRVKTPFDLTDKQQKEYKSAILEAEKQGKKLSKSERDKLRARNYIEFQRACTKADKLAMLRNINTCKTRKMTPEEREMYL